MYVSSLYYLFSVLKSLNKFWLFKGAWKALEIYHFKKLLKYSLNS
jgi:hypothetical protein